MNVNGSGVKQLTSEDLISLFPTYSPDGKKIAFEGDSPGSADIFTMNADGSDITKITNDLVQNCGGNCVISDWGAEPVD
jgi:Tol biopolymer transport system component